MRAPQPRTYMRAGRPICEVGKDGERMPNYWKGFFSRFAKKLRMGKSDDKLLEML
jgi:hypothetical protein